MGELPENECINESTNAAKSHEIDSTIELCLLGDTLRDRQLRNKAIVKLSDSLRTLQPRLPCKLVGDIWERTCAASLLRKLFVDYTIQSM